MLSVKLKTRKPSVNVSLDGHMTQAILLLAVLMSMNVANLAPVETTVSVPTCLVVFSVNVSLVTLETLRSDVLTLMSVHL